MNTTKRLYFYGVAFVSLAVTAYGSALLVQYALDLALGRTIVGDLVDQAAVGLAMVVVGGPLWVVHWAFAQRQAASDHVEAQSSLRALYLYGGMFAAAVIVFVEVRALLEWALGAKSWETRWVGEVLTWGVVWGYHWAVTRREAVAPVEGRRSSESGTVRRWYVYVTSGYALAFAGVGLASLLGLLFDRVYDGLTGAPALAAQSFWSGEPKRQVSSVVVGGLWWAFHWLYIGRGDLESSLRQVYLYLFAFLGGALTVLVSAGRIIHALLQWLLSAPGLPSGSAHFRDVASILATLSVGAALLLYHWQVVQEESRKLAGGLSAARRSFHYIMSGAGIGALASGAMVLLGLLVGLVLPSAQEPLVSTTAWRNLLAVALTLLLIGAPLWYWYWPRMQRQVRAAGAEERGALSRRIYVYGALGVLALAVLGSLIFFLTAFLSDALKGQFSLDFLREGKWALGVVITASALLPYHWQVLREDQRAGAESGPRKKSVTLVIGGDGAEDAARGLAKALDMPVRLVTIVSDVPAPVLAEGRLAELADQVRATPSDRAIVIADRDEIRVYGHG